MLNSPSDFAALHRALADELRDFVVEIEKIAGVIVSDEQFAMANLSQLQAFDMLVQRAAESAALLDRLSRGRSTSDAVGLVRLAVVQDRFRTALAAAA